MKRTFLEFVQSREKRSFNENDDSGDATSIDAESSPITSKITLGDNNDFQPFVVSDDPNSQFYGKNSGLAPIIRAFKKGGNWGWSKDEKTGEDKPVKMGSKKLFLTGGALRDHLKGKKSRNMELVTNSSPDEIYHTLVQNGFQYVGDENSHQTPEAKQTFWVKKKDKRGRPYTFGVKVKNDEFELSVFKKNQKDQDGILEPGNHADDASSRDFTINAMYLLLSNDNGPNKDLFDFYGGMRHLLDGRIASVGNLQQKIKEDPIRALRYGRMLARYGDPKKIPPDEREILKSSVDHLSKMKPEDVMDEFMKGMNYEDIDPRMYLKVFNHLGLLGGLFPGMQLDTNFPSGLRELGDKHAPIAFMLRLHTPEEVESRLSTIWRPTDLKKILFLIKSLQKLDDHMDEDTLEDLVQGYLQSGLSSRKLKMWASRLGGKSEKLVDAFLQHVYSPRVRVYAGGAAEPTEPFQDLLNPFDGTINNEVAEDRKRQMELDNFQRLLSPTP
jgi:tRNA nucleotidyltransferase/poly(A) polymerase